MITLKAFGSGRKRPLNLFFAEMIIALLFFSISGAVILKVFSSADMKSRDSARLERVIVTAQSIAEAYSESGDFDAAARLVLGDGISVEQLYGSGHVTVSIEDGSVELLALESWRNTNAGKLSELTMTFNADDKEIYSLTCSAYIRNGGEPGE